MTQPRKIRWYGDPTEERQPDTGDVLGYVDDTGRKPDWWHLVHYSWPVRGGGPTDLWLMVERLDFVDGVSIPDVVAEAFGIDAYFSARQLRRRPRWRTPKDTP